MLSSLRIPGRSLKLPAFFPDATRGVIRSVSSEDLESCGIHGVMVNVFHLIARPGIRVIAAGGGIGRFMNWRGAVAADSGGFQVYSLLNESPRNGSISNKGFVCRLERGGDKILLTPEKCVQSQFRLGADILFCLDCCTHPDVPADRQRQSVEWTVAWARKCRETYDRLVEQKDLSPGQRPLLLAVVQGGENPELRRECAERLLEIGFDGYGYGGWPVGRDGCLGESVAQVAELTPGDRLRFGLGIGKPENLVAAFNVGYRLFDCVIPTRDARRQRLYVFNDAPENSPENSIPAGRDFYRCLYLQDSKHLHDQQPVDAGCDCLCCSGYSRAYLHHLFRIGDCLANRLATIHNLRFYTRLVASLARGHEPDSK
jgi:queuine tRNA-ribosyltransferase